MDTQEAVTAQFAAYNFYEPNVDCSDMDTLAKTVTKAVEGIDTQGTSMLLKLGVIVKFVSDKLVDGPEAPAMHVQDAVMKTLENAKEHSPILPADARAFAEQIDEIVKARLGEMPMPGEAQNVVRALGLALKDAGKQLSAEHTGSR